MHKTLYEYKLYKVNGKKILSMDNIKREVSFQCKNRQRDKQIGFFFAKEFCSNIAVLLEAGLANGFAALKSTIITFKAPRNI
jgi:hypothetical protein